MRVLRIAPFEQFGGWQWLACLPAFRTANDKRAIRNERTYVQINVATLNRRLLACSCTLHVLLWSLGICAVITLIINNTKHVVCVFPLLYHLFPSQYKKSMLFTLTSRKYSLRRSFITSTELNRTLPQLTHKKIALDDFQPPIFSKNN